MLRNVQKRIEYLQVIQRDIPSLTWQHSFDFFELRRRGLCANN